MTDAERQQRKRDKRKAAGMVRVERWVPAHAEAAVRAAIDKAVNDAAKAPTGKEIRNDGKTCFQQRRRHA